ncbi:hypothetical protein B0H13DRAFT_881040 [Mycena leptocephala]|nr:hypothetical protein B0H13DRAFT_881040 [Mycena leptocephala]
MRLAFLVCVVTAFAAGDARAFGKLWGRTWMSPPSSPLCARCGRRGYLFHGTYMNGSARCTPYARRRLRALRCALSFFGLSCISFPLASLLNPPSNLYVLPLHPPTIDLSPLPAFPRSHTDKNSLLGPLHRRRARVSLTGIFTTRRPRHALTSVSRTRIAVAGLVMNALEVAEELLGVGGMRGCALHISGEEEQRRGRRVRSPSVPSFHLFVSCSLFCPALDAGLPFARPGFEARAARAGMRARLRGMACAGCLR